MHPALAVLASTLLWGTIWIPVRQLNGIGWAQDLVIPASCVIAAIAMLPYLHLKRQWLEITGTRVWVLGLVFAIGMGMYMEALVRGNVARVVLLFYLMPVWAAIFGRVINGDQITFRRLSGIVLGLSGMAVIFYDGSGIPLPSGVSDYMALLSGIVWAWAFTYLDRVPTTTSTTGQVFCSMATIGPIFYMLSLLPGSRLSETVGGLSNGPLPAEIWLASLGLVWLLPAVALTLFGAGRLQSSQVAIFLMLEVAISLASAALLLDEPFGMREMIGATLIISASFTEFTGFKKAKD